MPKSAILAAAIALVVLAGCGGSRNDTAARRPDRPDRPDRDENPNVLVQRAVESRTALSSIAGKGVMRIVDKPSKFGLTVNADVIADENDRLRIRADKLAGAFSTEKSTNCRTSPSASTPMKS